MDRHVRTIYLRILSAEYGWSHPRVAINFYTAGDIREYRLSLAKWERMLLDYQTERLNS